MENGCDLMDYRLQMGNIIDVTERVVLEEVDTNSANKTGEKKKADKDDKDDDPPKFSEEREPGNEPKPFNHSNYFVSN